MEVKTKDHYGQVTDLYENLGSPLFIMPNSKVLIVGPGETTGGYKTTDNGSSTLHVVSMPQDANVLYFANRLSADGHLTLMDRLPGTENGMGGHHNLAGIGHLVKHFEQEGYSKVPLTLVATDLSIMNPEFDELYSRPFPESYDVLIDHNTWDWIFGRLSLMTDSVKTNPKIESEISSLYEGLFRNYSNLLNENGRALVFYRDTEEKYVSKFVYPSVESEIGDVTRFCIHDAYRLPSDFIDFMAEVSGRNRDPDINMISPSHHANRVLLAQK